MYSKIATQSRTQLGSAMLQIVVEEATRKGAVQIWGVIVDHDVHSAPWLPAWYQKHGFDLSEPDEECTKDLKNAVKKITLGLPYRLPNLAG